MRALFQHVYNSYRGADKSLAWPGRKQEDFDFHISHL